MRLWSRAEPFLLPVLALVAEGAWLAVVYVAVETAVDGALPLLGTFELAVAAGIGAFLIRRRVLDPDERAFSFFAAIVAVGAAGWLWSAEVREALAGGDLFTAIGVHPGGWLTAVAFMRGVGRGVEIDDRALTRLAMWGVPGLAIPWILGQFATGTLERVFVEEAFVASLTFMSAAFMAAGLARLQAIGAETGVDWRANRSWLGLLAGVLLLVLAIGIPTAFFLGLPLDAVARGMVGPVATLLGYLVLAVVIPFAYLAAALYGVLHGIGFTLPAPMSPAEIAELPQIEKYGYEQLRGGLLALGVFWVLFALLAIVVLRTWLRRRARGTTRDVDEERSVRIPPLSLGVGMPRLRILSFGRTGRPRDAVAAYLAALEWLSHHAPLARGEAETPSAHASRVAGAGPGNGLRRLAADYALARYGARSLNAAEHRRALDRWRRLRRRLHR